MSKESLEVLARLSNTKINVRDVCDQWLLITYDLPKSEEGDKARRQFLVQAAAIGATRHTDSVYLMPWTPSAESLALGLSKVVGGKVVVWTSTTTDTVQAAEITRNYDASLRPILDEIIERIDRINEYQVKGWYKRANRMIPKTDRMLAQAEQAILRRGSASLYALLVIVRKRYGLI